MKQQIPPCVRNICTALMFKVQLLQTQKTVQEISVTLQLTLSSESKKKKKPNLQDQNLALQQGNLARDCKINFTTQSRDACFLDFNGTRARS